MKQNKNQFSRTDKIQSNNYQTETELHNGRKHIVVPVVMLVEGVHHGSMGPLFHSAAELSHFPASWNGIPIVVQHPQEDGQSVSANSPSIIETEVVGRVYNTNFSDGKLKAEAWLDEENMVKISPEALHYIRQGRPLDVSVGVFSDDEPTEGEWNGEAYTAISHNHRPDHLALLPGQQGACSWADGCGVRANQEGGDAMGDKIEIARKDYLVMLKSLSLYEVGTQQISQTIQQQLDSLDSASQMHFLEEVYKKYFVYRVHPTEGIEPPKYWKQAYSADKDGVVEFGETNPVIKKVEYVPQTNTMKRTKGGTDIMANEDKKPCCPEKVELLVQSDALGLGEDGRKWLEDQSEKTLDNLSAGLAAMARIDAVELELKEAKKEAPPQMNKEEAVRVLKEQLSDPEQFLALLPADQQAQMRHGMQLFKDHRKRLVDYIKANAPKDVYTDEELNTMESPDLEKLIKVIPGKRDFSMKGAGADVQNNVAVVAPLLPPGVEAA